VVALKTLMTATLGVKVLTLYFFDEMTLSIYIYILIAAVI